jgi:hypothetical protein
MTMRTGIVSGFAVLALAACSTAPPAGVYVKPGVSAEQLSRDRAECAAAAAASDSRRAVSAPDREDVDSCMRARGYTLSTQRQNDARPSQGY